MNQNKQDAATLLLNLECRNTGKTIQAGEIVKIHNWGARTSDEVISYGHFEWDTTERMFRFAPHKLMNLSHGLDEDSTVEDSYDLFRTTPAKLNKKEAEKLAECGDSSF